MLARSRLKQIPVQTDLDLSSLKTFVRDEILPFVNDKNRPKEFPKQILESLHQQGWVQAYIPTSLGGSGISTSDLIHVMREIAYGSSGIGTSIVANILGALPVLNYGNKNLAQKLAQESIQRFSLWSLCMTEPETGSDVGHLVTRASRVPGGYRIQGKKCFITNANHADHYTVFASVVDSSGADARTSQVTAFYIPAHEKGVRRGAVLEKLGQMESDTGEIFFDDVFVPEENRVGAEGEGLAIAFHSLQRSRVLISAMGVGICERAAHLLENDLNYRMRYGKPLLKQPVIYSLLAELYTQCEAAWLLTCQAAAVWDTGEKSLRESSMAKLFSADATVNFVNEVLELFGGYGYTTEFEISRLYRDAKLLEIYEGPSFVQQVLVAKELFPLVFSTKKEFRKAA